MTDLTYGRLRVAGGFLGIAVATVYFWLAIFSFGGGHGTAIPFVFAGPFPLGLLFFLFEGALFPDLRRRGWRLVFILLVLLQYALIAFNIFRITDPVEQFRRVADIPTTAPIWALGFFLAWQILIWAGFYVGVRGDRRKAGDFR